MLQVFFNLLFSTAKFACRVAVILTRLVLSSLGNAALAFFQTSNSKESPTILSAYDAQHALNEGKIDAPEYEHYRQVFED